MKFNTVQHDTRTLNLLPGQDSPIREGQVDVSFCAGGCGDVSLVIDVVVAALRASDEFG